MEFTAPEWQGLHEAGRGALRETLEDHMGR
jgi:hypothetical protein